MIHQASTNMFAIFNKAMTKSMATLVSLLSWLLFPVSSHGAEQTGKAQVSAIATDPMSASYLAQLIVGLLVVLLCIVLLAWFAKRFNGFQSLSGSSMRILGTMSMGARERVVLIQVGDNQILLGVAPGRVNTLHVLEESVDFDKSQSEKMTNSHSPIKSFADRLTAAVSKGKQP